MGGDTERQRTPHMDMHRKSTNEEEIEGRHPQELFNTIEQMRNRPAIANVNGSGQIANIYRFERNDAYI
jgi:hypothetical protein